MAIVFATALLGLVVGVHPVNLEVGAEVARVELLLDGELVGQRAGPPWEIPCDFGDDLSPHELVAVALDAAGEELGRAGQWVNYPHSANARARVAIDRAAILLDRTAVAVEIGRRGRDLDARALANRFTADGWTLERVEVVEGPAEVLVVMDREAPEGVLAMADLVIERRGAGRGITEEPVDPRSPTSRPRLMDSVGRGGESALGVLERRRQHLKTDMRLEEGQLVRFLWPVEEAPEGAVEGGDDSVRPDLFQHTRGLSPDYGGMLWLISVVDQPVFSPQKQRLADGVAAAGLTAAVSGRRRAVVLILGEDPADASRLSPAAVRGYLDHLGVPLHVWAVGRVPDAVADAWGGVRQVSSKRALRRAVKEVSKSLDRQRIVWLDGLFLPQEVVLTGEADDLHLLR